MEKVVSGSETIIKKTIRNIFTDVVLFIIGLYLIAIFTDSISQFPCIRLDTADASYTITRSDGSTETYYQNHFPFVQEGDSMTCEIAPLNDIGDIQNGTLVFSLYHCYVTVYCGDELIYQQTEPSEGEMIGHRYYVIPLPEGYENETIRIVALCAEHEAISSLLNPRIIPAECTTYAFRTGHFATGILLITLLTGSLLLEFSSLLSWLRDKRHDGLFSISFLISSACLWYMGFSGYIQPFVKNDTFLATVEYIGLYLTATAMPLFAQNHTGCQKLHRFCLAEAVILAGFFVFATIMTLSVPGISYVDFSWILRGIILFTLIVLLIAEIRAYRSTTDTGEKKLHIGLSITIILNIAEIVRFFLARQISGTFSWINVSIAPLCLLMLVLILFVYYGVKIAETQYQRIEQKNLERLAFIDQLTGAPNRTAFHQRMDEVKEKNITDYVVTFIDINFLKRTNDTWGHDKGDELIRTASDLLQKHYVGNDFFGRWGGDEFVAIHFGTLEEAIVIMNDIQQEIDAMNTSREHDFALSESWGFGESTSEVPLTPDEAIRRADHQMYMAKRKAHAARNQQSSSQASGVQSENPTTAVSDYT